MGAARSAAVRLITGVCVVVALASLGGCEGLQSALRSGSPGAREVAWLWWGMLSGGFLVFLLVLGLLLYTFLSRHQQRSSISANRFIIAGGVVLPIVVLSILVVVSLVIGPNILPAENRDRLTVHVKGHQWWWEIEYLDGNGSPILATANEIYVPVGEKVEFVLTSTDVIHSFWVPSLSGKLDLIPGHTNRLMIEADRPGIYRGQCAEYCGMAHALMAFYVVAVSPEEFDAWMQRQKAPAKKPQTRLTRQGAKQFTDSGCMLCHSVRGQGAWGEQGPDLTHVGSRLTIGAGLMKNNRRNLAAWIARNDHLKPGNEMPEYDHLDQKTLRALAAYLESLK